MNTIYMASPECRARECRWARWNDPTGLLLFYYQHGPNPEAVLRVDRVSARGDPAAYVRQQVREFAERCHQYEDGRAGSDALGGET